VPVRFARFASAGGTGSPDPRAVPAARVGLDALGTLAPTFDPAAGVLTLRRTGRTRALRGERVPALMLPDGLYLPTGGALLPLAVARQRGLVTTQSRWTFDRRRGEIVVER
jgi:hypothetical protein